LDDPAKINDVVTGWDTFQASCCRAQSYSCHDERTREWCISLGKRPRHLDVVDNKRYMSTEDDITDECCVDTCEIEDQLQDFCRERHLTSKRRLGKSIHDYELENRQKMTHDEVVAYKTKNCCEGWPCIGLKRYDPGKCSSLTDGKLVYKESFEGEKSPHVPSSASSEEDKTIFLQNCCKKRSCSDDEAVATCALKKPQQRVKSVPPENGNFETYSECCEPIKFYCREDVCNAAEMVLKNDALQEFTVQPTLDNCCENLSCSKHATTRCPQYSEERAGTFFVAKTLLPDGDVEWIEFRERCCRIMSKCAAEDSETCAVYGFNRAESTVEYELTDDRKEFVNKCCDLKCPDAANLKDAFNTRCKDKVNSDGNMAGWFAYDHASKKNTPCTDIDDCSEKCCKLQCPGSEYVQFDQYCKKNQHGSLNKTKYNAFVDDLLECCTGQQSEQDPAGDQDEPEATIHDCKTLFKTRFEDLVELCFREGRMVPIDPPPEITAANLLDCCAQPKPISHVGISNGYVSQTSCILGESILDASNIIDRKEITKIDVDSYNALESRDTYCDDADDGGGSGGDVL